MEPAVLTRATEKPDASAARKDRRLRAVYRRELLDSVAASARVVTAGIAVLTLVICLADPGIAPRGIALNAPLILLGAIIAGSVRHRGRRYVIPLGMILGWLPMLSASFSVVLVPAGEPAALGSLGLIPLAFAVFIPLQRSPHLAWLIVANAAFFACLVLSGNSALLGNAPAFAFTAALASALSLGANEVQLRRRSEMDRQVLAVRGLYRQMKENEQDLRRQDEFLFMQQETLVVQQAELLRLNQELETIARLDPLTGMGNRLRLNEDLAQVAARIERNGGSAGLLLMDLDRFKRLNDTQGHLAGDAALRGVADVLRKTSRVGDGVYRYGGEEFLIILHDCNEAVLRLAGQRYLSAIQAAGIPHKENTPWGVVTASAGAADLSQRNCVDIDSALRDSDEALYEAKARGRNRLEVHNGATVTPIEHEQAAS
jgi:diguanylate cyclase (GGDEF)-like protein